MKFDYDYYKRTLFSFPLIMIIIFIFLLLIMLIFTIVNRKKVIENKLLSLITYILLFGFIFFGLIDSIGHLKYGINLNTESPKNALIIKGEIERIEELKNPFTHGYKIAPNGKINAHIITISEKEYYFMTKGDLQVGDCVEIKYLPKSTIVLEVKIIESDKSILI